MATKSIYNKVPFLFPFVCLWGGFYMMVKYWQVNIWISILGFICFCYGLTPKMRAIMVFANHSAAAKKALIGIIIVYVIVAGISIYHLFW